MGFDNPYSYLLPLTSGSQPDKIFPCPPHSPGSMSGHLETFFYCYDFGSDIGIQ